MFLVTVIYVIFICHPLAASTICPKQWRIHIKQTTAVVRPKGLLEFSCTLTGANITQVQYYMWEIRDINHRLFVYSKSHHESTDDFKDMYIDESHIFSSSCVESKLRLLVNIYNNYTFRCTFIMAKAGLCRKSIRIKFEDPRIGLRVKDKFIYCGVNDVTDQTNVSLTYARIDGDVSFIPTTKCVSEKMGYYFYSSCTSMSNLPSQTTVTCHVTDIYGTYRVETNVTDDKSDFIKSLQTNVSHSPSIAQAKPAESLSEYARQTYVIAFTIMTLVIIILIIVVFIMCYKGRLKKGECSPFATSQRTAGIDRYAVIAALRFATFRRITRIGSNAIIAMRAMSLALISMQIC